MALSAQLQRARGGGRIDYSRPQGRPGRGVIYAFTVAMLPSHKESIRNHPVEFLVGALMHLGVIVALLGILLAGVHPGSGVAALQRLRPLLWLALIAGLWLGLRRLGSRDLRAMSSPDDYVAILASCGLLIVTSLIGTRPVMPVVAMLYTAALLVYVPLGKLRHIVFFFAARADYGRRLGYRGVYPPATE